MTKSEKVPILGIFSPQTILMFRVGLKNRTGRQQEPHIYFINSSVKFPGKWKSIFFLLQSFSLYCVFNITSIFLVSFTVNHYFSTLIFLIKLAKVFSCDYFRFHNRDIYKKEHSSWQTLLIAATARLRIGNDFCLSDSLSICLSIYLSTHP